jgi:metacaspase-1
MADRALLIGINTFRSIPGLRGCENDAIGMRHLLVEKVHFDSSGIRMLINADATGANVRQHLVWLASDVQPGDRRFLHVSSHGSCRVDRSGDEADGRDELVCLYDMDFGDAHTFLLDDYLARYTGDFSPEASLTIVLDCCHSGTGTRELVPPPSPDPTSPCRGPRLAVKATRHRAGHLGDDELAQLDPADTEAVLARFAAPPPAVEVLAASLPRRRQRMVEPEIAADVVLFAACAADQTAADAYIDGKFRGAFTHALCRVVGEIGYAVGRSEMIGQLRKAMKDGGFTQVPQYEAARSRGVVLPRSRR